jgi:threonine aldolase
VIDPALIIDLRSDTVTLPSAPMREVMGAAPVGNDEYGEDPTVNRLQDRTAALLGKEAGLWLPSGTMANQVALRVLTRPGDDVIVSRESHTGWHEAGGPAANSGVQLTEIGAGGVFTREGSWPRGSRLTTPCTRRPPWSRSRTRTTAPDIVFRLTGEAPDAPTLVARARERGVLVFGIGPRVIRAVTHLEVSRKQCEEAAEILVDIAES